MKHARRLLENQVSADELAAKLLGLSRSRQICLLDSCGVAHLGSHLLICGVNPLETYAVSHENADETLNFLDEKLANPETFAIFTISYNFGHKLERIKPPHKPLEDDEPDVFLAVFDCLIIHDYNTRETFLFGNEDRFRETEKLLDSAENFQSAATDADFPATKVKSNFTKAEYLEKIEEIKEFIRRGDTYQTNLTQQFTAELPENLTPPQIFHNLRKNHPAPFASFIRRGDSTVVSASPERFFRVGSQESGVGSLKASSDSRLISTSPIKGTRPRGSTADEDAKLRAELLNSEKDRAENVMIVDLLRNDLGRICEFGTVAVEKLCDLEEHPTLFHLVSTVEGKLRRGTSFSDILRAVFPCGSITGAPKISTMRIIERLETAQRDLSMGAIGVSVPCSMFHVPGQNINNMEHETSNMELDLSVAIRTMVIKNRRATFNVGGGIVIDSDPEQEYAETLTKAKALISSINGKFDE